MHLSEFPEFPSRSSATTLRRSSTPGKRKYGGDAQDLENKDVPTISRSTPAGTEKSEQAPARLR
jgi:hypothetical protein